MKDTVSGSEMIISAIEMIISATKKIVEATKKIVEAMTAMVEATNEMVYLIKTEVLTTEMILSVLQKICRCAEMIIPVANTIDQRELLGHSSLERNICLIR